MNDFWNDDDQELANIDVLENCVDCENISAAQRLECDSIIRSKGTPQICFRPEYLTVSDLVKQQWCEQQLVYSLDPGIYLMRAPPGMIVDIEETPEQKLVKKKGSDIHFERELEIQVPVQVNIETKEDDWGVKFLNLQFAVQSFYNGNRLAREIPVFGVPFDKDVFVYGIIDELQYNLNEYRVIITELKTRRNSFPPKQGQIRKDKYQVSLYAQLFNDFVEGRFSKELMAAKLQLKVNAQFSKSVMKHITQSRINSANKIHTLGALIDAVLTQVQAMPRIHFAKVEYIHQETKQFISVVDFCLDFQSLAEQYSRHIEWWLAKRGTTGVEVEDCWKCSYCLFSEFCEWRKVMAERTTKEAYRTKCVTDASLK
ncbi:exonuclease V [Biomphalaria pfeifferi]|uniref:Exonuclease V n=1 Tax=Biomphalaria pfeifferi TaxID=112525 RepID=A0AAD8BQ73_BIOPF|nr:exonuclease V [Biomphalaria pfeifferi]